MIPKSYQNLGYICTLSQKGKITGISEKIDQYQKKLALDMQKQYGKNYLCDFHHLKMIDFHLSL